MNDDDPRLTSDVSDFDFDRSAQDSWRLFAERLGEVLSMMDAGATLAIGALGEPGPVDEPYVRFRCVELGTLTVEAVVGGLGDAQVEGLVGAGWQRADDGTLARTGDQERAEEVATWATDALRDVFGVQHPALLAPDQLADILTPTPTEGAPLSDAVTPPGALVGSASVRVELEAAVADVLTRRLGHEPLRDDQGDFALRVGTTMVFVRPSEDAHEVLVFAPLVHDVEGRSRAMEVLSDLNTDARWVRFLLIRDRVYVSMSVMAAPLVPVHLERALHTVSLISDSIDEALADKLRGRTTFTEGESGA